MKHKIFLFTFSFFLILSFGSFEWVLACSCVPNVPCQSYQNADVIFVGKVVEKKRIKDSVFTQKFEIIESFKGVKKEKQIQIIANEHESICGYNFKLSETYLVYAYKSEDGKFGTGLCSRTKLLAQAQEDLNFLQNLSGKSAGRIFGQIGEKLTFRKDKEIKAFANLPLKFIEKGNKQNTYETITDVNGNYEIFVLEGNYEVIPIIPNYAQIPDDQSYRTKVTIQANGCESVNFLIANKGQITGKLISSNGEAISKVTVELIDFETNEWVTDVKSESDGSFKFDDVAAGKYVLAINKNLLPHTEAPFPTTYFPKTSDLSKAKIIEISFGQTTDQILFQVLPKLIEKEIRGTVFGMNGKPAKDARVQLEDFDKDNSWYRSEKNGKTDEFGNFVVKGFIGRKYKIKATNSGKYESATTLPFILEEDSVIPKIMLEYDKPQ